MPATPALSPSAAKQIATGGPAWADAGLLNVVTSNNSYCSATVNASTPSQPLLAYGFGAAVPADQVITGIEVRIERKRGAGTVTFVDSEVALSKDALLSVGLNRADTVTAWPTTDAIAVYGGLADLWGTTWTPAEVNSSNFGVWLRVVRTAGTTTVAAQVDHVTATVYYEPAPPPVQPPAGRSSGSSKIGGRMVPVLGYTALARMCQAMETDLVFDGMVCKLFKEPVLIQPDALPADFVEADFTGYGSKPVVPTTAFIHLASTGQVIWEAPTLVFQPTGDTLTNTVYGYWIEGLLDGTGVVVVTAASFDEPILMTGPLSVCQVRPIIPFGQPGLVM